MVHFFLVAQGVTGALSGTVVSKAKTNRSSCTEEAPRPQR